VTAQNHVILKRKVRIGGRSQCERPTAVERSLPHSKKARIATVSASETREYGSVNRASGGRFLARCSVALIAMAISMRNSAERLTGKVLARRRELSGEFRPFNTMP